MGGTTEAVVQFVKFSCAKCGQPILAPAEGEGEELDCPGCKEKLTIPVAGEAKLRTVCPRCGQKLKVPAGSAETEIKCPLCTHAFLAPAREPQKERVRLRLPKLPKISLPVLVGAGGCAL